MTRHTLALAIAALLLLPTGAAVAAPERADTAGPPTVAPTDRIIVEWEAGVDGVDRVDARDAADTDLVRTLGKPSFQLVEPQPGQSTADALAALRDDPSVRAAERDGINELHATTNDPLFGQLWGLQNLGLGIDGAPAIADADIDADRAWDRTRGSASTVVADLDTGYRFDYADLAAVAWTNPRDPANGVDDDANGLVDDVHGADFAGTDANSPTTDPDPTDNQIDGGHGVHTAGTIGAAGNDGVGISGVAQDVRIMPLRVCTTGGCAYSSQIQAINYAGSHGARVANMSLGGRGSVAFRTTVRDAFARNPNVLFVISAGNDAEDNDSVAGVHYPCDYDPSTSGIPGAIDNIVCVAATTQTDGLASFSDWGRTTVDLGAPGTEILSTYPLTFPLQESFGVNDFASRWTAVGADGGFARTNESWLAPSFGISDSPGVDPPPANAVRESRSVAVTVPPNGGCRLTQSRRVDLGTSGTYRYSVFLNGVEQAGTVNSPASTDPARFRGLDRRFIDLPAAFNAGGSVSVDVRFTTGASPSASSGVWLDDIELRCMDPLGQAHTYGFLDGTSMAAPHVTGTAALLFSLKPSASVAEVKNALLSSVDPVASLAGITTTGGRLNAAAALDALVPPPAPPAPPVVPPPGGGARIAAVRCVVPRLAGLSLAGARAALSRAHCALGNVTKPRARRGRRLPKLVVKSSRPGAGATGAEGTKVALTLKAKPRARRRRARARHRRHARRRR
jgi:subtilisin family serine protease